MPQDDPFGYVNTPLTQPAQQFRDQQSVMQNARNQQEGVLQAFEAGRQPVYQQLQAGALQASMPGLERQRATGRRQAAFTGARTGTTGGSADLSRQAMVEGNYQAGVGQAEMYGADLARGVEQNDIARLFQARQALASMTPGEQALVQSVLSNLAAQSEAAQQYGNLQAQRAGIDPMVGQNLGAILGQGLSGISGTLSAIGQTGGFDPYQRPVYAANTPPPQPSAIHDFMIPRTSQMGVGR